MQTAAGYMSSRIVILDVVNHRTLCFPCQLCYGQCRRSEIPAQLVLTALGNNGKVPILQCVSVCENMCLQFSGLNALACCSPDNQSSCTCDDSAPLSKISSSMVETNGKSKYMSSHCPKYLPRKLRRANSCSSYPA